MSKKIFPVVMPKLGMEMTEGQIAMWHFAEGDSLPLGAELAEIETDKLSMAYEVEFEGRLKYVMAEEGVIYPVGQLLAVIAADGVSDSEIEAFVSSYIAKEPEIVGAEEQASAGESSTAAEELVAAPQKEAVTAEAVQSEIEAKNLDISPIAARLAVAHGVDLSAVKGTGRLGRISVADVELVAGEPLGRRATRLNASPAARRCARRRGIDIDSVQGTGPKGRVLKGDVEAASSVTVTQSEPAPGPAGFRSEPVSLMRKTIARRLVQSKAEAPHHYLRIELHMADLMKVRAGVNRRLQDRKVSVNDFIVRAVGLALQDVPEANVQYTDDEMRFYDQADVGVAVAVEGGLVTPVVQAACQKSLVQVSGEITSFANRARSGGLKPEDMAGGTITVTNLGMYGIQSFDAVVNPPQGAIVAVGAVEERPANVDGKLALAPMMHLTLSCDHRAIDGAVGARYLAALKELLENPVSLVM